MRQCVFHHIGQGKHPKLLVPFHDVIFRTRLDQAQTALGQRLQPQGHRAHGLIPGKGNRLNLRRLLKARCRKHVRDTSFEVLHATLHVPKDRSPVLLIELHPAKGVHAQLHSGKRCFELMGDPKEQVTLPLQPIALLAQALLQSDKTKHQDACKNRTLAQYHVNCGFTPRLDQ